MTDLPSWLVVVLAFCFFAALRWWGDSSAEVLELLRSIEDRFDRLGTFVDREWPELQNDISKLDRLETIIDRLDDTIKALHKITDQGKK